MRQDDTVRLWVDDLRPAPDGWELAKTSAEALAVLREHLPFALSLDHDLGGLGGDDTTRPIVLWMCEHEQWPSEVYLHTANPVGWEWLAGMVERYAPQGTLRSH